MFPADDNLDYPKFIANQVLQSKHLNDMFEYLDEQNRLTRTNLIGIGVMCGMDVVPVGATQLKITKGVGVTSAGYLVEVPEKTYQNRKDYTVPPEIEYLPFYNKPAKTNRFPMWELTEGTPAGSVALDAAFLSGSGNENDRKVVLIFVELLYSDNHNCSPNSCDDKGANVKITFRPLLMRKADAITLLNEVKAFDGGTVNVPDASFLLPDMKIKRVNVPKTDLITVQNVVDAYRNVLTRGFVETTVKQNWITAFNTFNLLLTGIPNTLTGWNPPFAIDNKIQLPNPYEYQYYYDFIADLIEVYEELQQETGGVLAVCCPDERLFPRHLFLGLATENTKLVTSDFRHYFIPSPILGNKNLIKARIISLFKKAMKLLSFAVPVPPKNVRITPSKLGDFLLSKKAIPYYYDVTGGTEPLFSLWNYKKTSRNKSRQNLSYHAVDYPDPKPDFVVNPLLYDLEPYNFLRIEGHVGKNYKDALLEITNLRDNNRLPFDVLAIRTGEFTKNSDGILNYDCNFQDLEINYDVARREWECCIGMAIEYLDDVLPVIDILPVRKNRIRQFEKQLVKAKKFMVNDLPEFVKKWIEFITAYEAIELEARAIRKLLENDLEIAHNDRNVKDDFEIEDLIDHLDSVIQSCQKGPFRAIYQEYKKRLALIKEKLLLKNYANANPSLQHKAGVPLGGTFILVYDDNPSTKNTVFADFYLPYLCCSDCSPSQVVIEKTDVPPLSAVLVGEPVCDPQGANFSIQIVITGGKAPYKASGASIPGNVVSIVTKSGQGGSVEITDDDGQKVTVTIPAHTCQIPAQPLVISATPPVCAQDFLSYSADVTITGGTAPFSYNGTPKTSPFKVSFNSGVTGVVQVKDSLGINSNTLTIPAQNCCQFPCNGKLLTCQYPFIPIPQQEILISATLDEFVFDGQNLDLKMVSFNFPFNAGLETDFKLNPTSYPVFRTLIVKEINNVIGARIGQIGLVTMIEDSGEKAGIISIANYQCNDFSIRISFKIKESVITYTYSPQGLVINDENGSQLVPKFNCSLSDQCSKNAEAKPLCNQDVKINNIKISRPNRAQPVYDFEVDPNTPGAKYYWLFEAKNGVNPSSSTARKPRITFSPNENTVSVKVFVIINGCMKMLEKVLELGNQ